MDADRIRENLQSVTGRIARAEARSGRPQGSARLIAVTKRNPPERIRHLIDLGVKELAENYPQELWKKAEALREFSPTWHLIGHLQGNKVKRTFPLVRMIHAVDSLKLLRELDRVASGLPRGERPEVCLQVNTSDEEAKHGWSAESLLLDAEAVAACREIPVVGLMTMAAYGTDAESARPSFVELRRVRDELRTRTGLALEHLSMGMSNDFETAIEEGATLVRVGSALFEGAEG
ncbi:YggS family pyridoxal phosphate-dependent enzyme [Singulisphaera sp. PoT]|uniref:YggS family pyridoxal phosphate-dependent enzyme n=1 Tax=Singulisphaera sp. PoT TaxID=3411797 RepID=UPI003BF5D529